MLNISKVQFGELDARNEVFQQSRNDSMVFFNSYQIPPGVNFDSILSGSKYFITGQKGTGKTALIWYLKHRIEEYKGHAEIVLFKSDLTEAERQHIASLTDTNIFVDQGKISIQYDYKQNWLWFIIRTISKMLEYDDLDFGKESLHDLKELTGVNKKNKQTIFSGLQFTKIRVAIETAIKTGVFKSGIKGELEAIYSKKDSSIIDIISMCEQELINLKVKDRRRYCLLFDELELFLNKVDQRDRDLALIRDLLYAVSRINRKFGTNNSITIYASVRSEVLQEVNRIGPEIRRDVSDFGAEVLWNINSQSSSQPILNIVEAKIQASELENGLKQTADVWDTYLPKILFGKNIKQYLLDISMYKPRNLVRRLKLAQAAHYNEGSLISDDFSDSAQTFSSDVWSEIEEDLLSSYTPMQVSCIKSILSGFQVKFNLSSLKERIERLSRIDVNISTNIRGCIDAAKIAYDLYRVGAIGNVYRLDSENRHEGRDRWVFRNYLEPLLDKDFIIHESLRKNFQLLR